MKKKLEPKKKKKKKEKEEEGDGKGGEDDEDQGEEEEREGEGKGEEKEEQERGEGREEQQITFTETIKWIKTLKNVNMNMFTVNMMTEKSEFFKFKFQSIKTMIHLTHKLQVNARD